MSMNVYDVVIIGGGVVGASIARELSRYKVTIALLEKETELAFGVSKSNSGIIHPGTQNKRETLKGKLCVEGNRLTRSIARELGVDFKEVGELICAFDEAEVPRLFELKQEAEALGVTRLEIVYKPWLKIHEPNLSDEVVAALYAPTAGIISPYRWVYDLAENAARNGADIFTNTKVTRIDQKNVDAVRFDIHTTNGMFHACSIVNAAGLFADEVARMVGIDNITIRARKGEEFLLDKKREYLTKHLLFPLPDKTSKGMLVIKTSDGNPMVGPTAVDSEAKDDLATSAEGLKKVFASARRLVPAISENDIIAYFAGLRPVAGDDFIIRHEATVPGCITVAGIQSPGLTAAPAIAREVVELLQHSGLTLKKKMFFHRFRQKTNHLFAIPFNITKKLIKKDPDYGDIVCRCEMVSAQEIKEAIARGARTLDGVKFRTRAQAGRCHGGFCTTRIMKIMAEELNMPLDQISKRGHGSELIMKERGNGRT
jgi:glycerol-3-phosphate dehydrogenase